MPKILTKTALVLALVSMGVFPALGQRTNPRPAWNLFSPQQDTEMGRALADDAERTIQLVDDHNANVYIDALGKQLVAHAPGTRFSYQFKIVNDDAVNAWALPGGYIYVTRGLINAAESEPQLAGAIAHEIAHVAMRHGTAEVSQEYRNRGSNSNRVSVNDAMNTLNIRFERDAIPLKYSRDEERQADVVATQIMYDTGFDPMQMTQMFQRITNDRSYRSGDFSNAHPDLSNRTANVRAELRNLGGLRRNVRGDSPDFHSVKDRLVAFNNDNYNNNNSPSVYGRDRADVPSSRMVLYTGRDVEFRYPDNWRVSEETDSISVAPEQGYINGMLAYGMTVASFDPQRNSYGRNSFSNSPNRADTTTLSNATNQLIDQLQQSNPNMRVLRDTERRRVDGAQAMVVRLSNDSPLGGSETNWLVTVLRPNGMLRYFVGVAPDNEFNRYQQTFEQIISSAHFLD